MNETGVTSHRRGQAVNSNEFPQFGQPPATTPLLILLRLLVNLDYSYQIVQADANIFGETYGRYFKSWFFGGQTRRSDTWSPRWHYVPLQHKCMNSYGTDWDWDSGRWSQISMWHPWHSLPWLLFETSCESQIRISTQFALRLKWKAEIE